MYSFLSKNKISKSINRNHDVFGESHHGIFDLELTLSLKSKMIRCFVLFPPHDFDKSEAFFFSQKNKTMPNYFNFFSKKIFNEAFFFIMILGQLYHPDYFDFIPP